MAETNTADAFPILCDGCLGPNKFLRMSKDILGAACKVCGRPYDVFKWRADNDGHIRQTECCQLCAKIKNMCSTCLLDLEFRLPAHIRDAVLEPDEVMRVPTNQANREFLYEQHEKLIASAGKDASDHMLALPYGKSNPASILERLESRKPYNRKRDLQNICKDYMKGTCPRGSNCPYRHETPLSHKTSDQVLVERFRIENTPRTYTPDGLPPPPPVDPTITTLFVGGNDNSIDDNDLVDHFSQFGHVASVRAIPAKACAFVEFMDRSGAENAVMKNWEKCVIRGIPLRIAWARPRVIRPEALMAQEAQAATESQKPLPDATKFMKIPPPPAPAAHILPPPGMYPGKRKLYPSQDPKAGAAKMF